MTLDDIDEFLFFYGSYHYCTTSWITGDVLTWNDSTTTSLTKGLLMSFDKSILLCIKLQNNKFSRIRTNHYSISAHSLIPQHIYCTKYTKQLLSNDKFKLSIFIDLIQFNTFCFGNDNLLTFG